MTVSERGAGYWWLFDRTMMEGGGYRSRRDGCEYILLLLYTFGRASPVVM